MIMTASFAAFTNQYQISKTLRFELKPVAQNNFYYCRCYIVA